MNSCGISGNVIKLKIIQKRNAEHRVRKIKKDKMQRVKPTEGEILIE